MSTEARWRKPTSPRSALGVISCCALGLPVLVRCSPARPRRVLLWLQYLRGLAGCLPLLGRTETSAGCQAGGWVRPCAILLRRLAIGAGPVEVGLRTSAHWGRFSAGLLGYPIVGNGARSVFLGTEAARAVLPCVRRAGVAVRSAPRRRS